MTNVLKLRLQSLCNLDGWCSDDKAAHLAELVRESKPKIAVELGVYGGRGIGAIEMAVQEYGIDCQCFGVDPWSTAAATEGNLEKVHVDWWKDLDIEKIYADCVSGMRRLGLCSVQLLRMKDDEAIKQFNNESIDMIHIDANHSEECSTRIVKTWLPKCSQGAVIVFDDIDWSTQSRAIVILTESCDITFNNGAYLVAVKR